MSDHKRYRQFQGVNGRFGVCESGGGVLYEADFDQRTADAVAALYNGDNPPDDWEDAEVRLRAAGVPIDAVRATTDRGSQTPVAQCPKHPLSQAKAEIERLEHENAELKGSLQAYEILDAAGRINRD